MLRRIVAARKDRQARLDRVEGGIGELVPLPFAPFTWIPGIFWLLGKIAFDSFLAAYQENGGELAKPRPKFGHGAAYAFAGGFRLICSYHPSQQNTFTGKLTGPMFESIFKQTRRILSI